jgi:hypothetical protein
MCGDGAWVGTAFRSIADVPTTCIPGSATWGGTASCGLRRRRKQNQSPKPTIASARGIPRPSPTPRVVLFGPEFERGGKGVPLESTKSVEVV